MLTGERLAVASAANGGAMVETPFNFDGFYNALIPGLVEFVERLGITPAHHVLKQAVRFADHLDTAIRDIAVANEKERSWMILHVGYFIGEYFSQKYKGCWYINEREGSRYFARYVVGQFSNLPNSEKKIDPFEIAKDFADGSVPRKLKDLIGKVETELLDLGRC